MRHQGGMLGDRRACPRLVYPSRDREGAEGFACKDPSLTFGVRRGGMLGDRRACPRFARTCHTLFIRGGASR